MYFTVGYSDGEIYFILYSSEGENIKITYPEDIFLADRLFQVKSISCSKTENLKNEENEKKPKE